MSSYLGRGLEQVDNISKLDNLSFNGGTTYALTKDSAAFTPISSNALLVSIDGVIQQGNFSVSGTNIVFNFSVSGSSTCNFILHYGTGVAFTPADNSITKDKTNFVSTSSSSGLQIKGDGTTDGTLQLNCSSNSHGVKIKSPNHSSAQSYTLTLPGTAPAANKVLQTDGSGNLSFADAGGNAPAFMANRSANIAVTNNARNKVQCDTEIFDSGGQYDNSSNFRFTPTTAGKYYVFGNAFLISGNSQVNWILNEIWKNGTSGTRISASNDHRNNPGNSGNHYVGGILDMNGSSDYIELYTYPGVTSGTPVISGTNTSLDTYFGAYLLAGV